MLWPYYNLSFRFDPEELLDRYVDRDPPLSLSELHRALALRVKRTGRPTGASCTGSDRLFQLALVLLLLDILAWLVSIASPGVMTATRRADLGTT